MIKEFYHSNERLHLLNTPKSIMFMRHRKLLQILRGKLIGKLLEADQRNPLTEKIEREYKCQVDTVAQCDFNFELETPSTQYDVVISAHVIEHLSNQLTYLSNISSVMKSGGKLHILFPQRPQFLWTDHHFHEVDDYRFRLIAKEAGFIVISCKKWKFKNKPLQYFKGIRPLLRFFLDREVYYILEKQP